MSKKVGGKHNIGCRKNGWTALKRPSREPKDERLTFCEASERTSCGRMSSRTTASASESLWSASRPRASAAVCWMPGTPSSIRGRSRVITPAGEERITPWEQQPHLTCLSGYYLVSLTSILKHFYVLWSGCQISDRLHKLHPWLLILLKNCKQTQANSLTWSCIFLIFSY